MAPKKKELDAQLRDLAERHDALVEIVQRLATHTAVVALALRDPEAVPPPDLDAALTGISDINTALLTRSPAN
ncbi:MAG: hypothetical protein E6G12_06790 [Actinobacteria bacterium]|nr:MAG: hypothetical protein E6G12_06790 [Actinomycetota bacterium]